MTHEKILEAKNTALTYLKNRQYRDFVKSMEIFLEYKANLTSLDQSNKELIKNLFELLYSLNCDFCKHEQALITLKLLKEIFNVKSDQVTHFDSIKKRQAILQKLNVEDNIIAPPLKRGQIYSDKNGYFIITLLDIDDESIYYCILDDYGDFCDICEPEDDSILLEAKLIFEPKSADGFEALAEGLSEFGKYIVEDDYPDQVGYIYKTPYDQHCIITCYSTIDKMNCGSLYDNGANNIFWGVDSVASQVPIFIPKASSKSRALAEGLREFTKYLKPLD